MQKQTFEEQIVPVSIRREAAALNILLVWASAAEAEARPFAETVFRELPWLKAFVRKHKDALERGVTKVARLPYVTLHPRGGCQLSCAGCGSGQELQVWRPQPDHATFEQIRPFLTYLRLHSGLRMIRVTGEGEPTIAPDFSELVTWATEHEVRLVVCTNGLPINKAALEYYRRSSMLHFYVKHLGTEELQAKITKGYDRSGKALSRFVEVEELGFVPEVFTTLADIDPSRVGFRATIYRENAEAVRDFLARPGLRNIPVFVGAVEEIGDAMGRSEILPVAHGCKETTFLDRPRWSFTSVALAPQGRIMQGDPSSKNLTPGISVVGVDPADVVRELFRFGEYASGTLFVRDPLQLL